MFVSPDRSWSQTRPSSYRTCPLALTSGQRLHPTSLRTLILRDLLTMAILKLLSKTSILGYFYFQFTQWQPKIFGSFYSLETLQFYSWLKDNGAVLQVNYPTVDGERLAQLPSLEWNDRFGQINQALDYPQASEGLLSEI